MSRRSSRSESTASTRPTGTRWSASPAKPAASRSLFIPTAASSGTPQPELGLVQQRSRPAMLRIGSATAPASSVAAAASAQRKSGQFVILLDETPLVVQHGSPAETPILRGRPVPAAPRSSDKTPSLRVRRAARPALKEEAGRQHAYSLSPTAAFAPGRSSPESRGQGCRTAQTPATASVLVLDRAYAARPPRGPRAR